MTEDVIAEREQILASSLDARVREVMHYQINIDNYGIALKMLEQMDPTERAELAEFEEKLRGLLASEILEQKKAKLMLAVIESQVK